MRRPSRAVRIAALLAAVSVALSLCGCAESLRGKAQKQLESSVADASRSLGQAAVTAEDAIDLVHRSPLIDYSRYKAKPDSVSVFATGWYDVYQDGDHVAIFVLARGSASSGGGLMYSDQLVFRCVKLEVELGTKSTSAQMTRIDCPADIRKLAHITKETPEI
ncbi:hypothetical protein N136_00131 [Leifsonia aquatica ATCC 14665]|uniref:Lipoprotein n=1 Tax=Leifsonia aquatica ATCC 14665 TaxID=1358026 RepID=U2T7W7_LEIAQ|nr:hypothetical protein N136_00131 [Leifsonia aquatica ATCC 14665]